MLYKSMEDDNGPIFSVLSGKPADVLLYGCSGASCTPSLKNLCNLNLTSGCGYTTDCSEVGSDWTGQNEMGSPPAALVCCSDLGFSWGFSQAFLDEKTWDGLDGNSGSNTWCSDYAGNVCGNFPVNNYNRCQYLMFIYGPTQAGDYCDRLELYINGSYSSANLTC